MLSSILSALIMLACILLNLAVLIQNPKGGGLASGFTSGSQVMGVRRTADFLEKATWVLAIALFVFSIFTAKPGNSSQSNVGTSITKSEASKLDKAPPGTQFPVQNTQAAPMQQPAQPAPPKKP